MALSKPEPLFGELIRNRRIQLTVLKAFLEFRDILFPFRGMKEYNDHTPTKYKRMIILFIVTFLKWRGYFKLLINDSNLRNSTISTKCKFALLIGIFGHFLIFKSQLTDGSIDSIL